MVFGQRTTVYLFSVLGMKKFVVKCVLFSLPIAFLFLFTSIFYATDKGDLTRVGYLIEKKNYRTIFENELNKPILFSKVSQINWNKPQKFTVLTIGDSFSEQFGYGYKNYLAQNNTSVLHVDRFLSGNPIQTAHGILNGDLLDKIKVNYIILQSVERDIVVRAQECKTDTLISLNSINQNIKEYNSNLKKSNFENNSELLKIKQYFRNVKKTIKIDGFSANRLIKFPLQNIRYLFDDNAYDSDTYKVKTKQSLFSVKTNDLLFLCSDLNGVKENNDKNAVSKLNEVLNSLSKKCKEKGIALIVLPSPDKFDFYYDEIVENQKYIKPLFFEHFDKLPKEYCYINPKKLLQEKLVKKKDIYFYDDTHWSPWSSKVLAAELKKNMVQKNTSIH